MNAILTNSSSSLSLLHRESQNEAAAWCSQWWQRVLLAASTAISCFTLCCHCSLCIPQQLIFFPLTKTSHSFSFNNLVLMVASRCQKCRAGGRKCHKSQIFTFAETKIAIILLFMMYFHEHSGLDISLFSLLLLTFLRSLFQGARVLSTERSVFAGEVETNLLPASLLLLKWYAEKEGGKGNDLYISCILSCFIFLPDFQSVETGVY